MVKALEKREREDRIKEREMKKTEEKGKRENLK